MKTKIHNAVVSIISGMALVGSVALAQETGVKARLPTETKSGLTNAFELALGIGYNQGVGDVGTGVQKLTDTGGPGGSGELDLGWRIDPNWMVGVYGTVALLSTGDSPGNARNNWTTTAGIQGNYHFLPGENVDPWIGLGVGWRGYFVNRPEGWDNRHGLEFTRVQVGLDLPMTTNFVLSPFIGASANIFFTQQLATQTSYSNITSPNVNFFLNAGLIGRFDLFGTVTTKVGAL